MDLRLAVLGPGGVGGFIAAALARSGQDVTVVAREQTAEVINRSGITVESVLLGDFQIEVPAVSQLSEPVDYLFVTSKATGLETALERIEALPKTVIPLLNGIEHLTTLRQHFTADCVVPATIRIESTLLAPAQVRQNSPAVQVTLARSEPELSAVLETAGLSVVVGEGEADVIWGKLVRINTIACCTAASGMTFGEVRNDSHWMELARKCAEESVAVAAAAGAQVQLEEVLAELERVHPDLKSSLQRDLEAGRPSEIDAIPGAVLREADRYGVKCPTVEQLVELIRARELSAPSA